MDQQYLLLIVIGIMGGVAVLNAALNYLTNKRILRHNNKLVKAIIANNVAEYAAAERTPADEIEILDKENELAKEAAKLTKGEPETRIPI